MKSEKSAIVVRVLPWLMIIAGAIGLLSSFALTVEKIAWLKDPSYQPVCNINPLFSCVSVSSSPQAEVFGAPNMVFGLIAFAVVLTIGASMLFGAAGHKPWFWRLYNLGALAGVLFVHWLFVQSVYVIGALCLFCMAVWVVTIALFWYLTLYNIHNGHMPVPKRLKPLANFMFSNHGILLAGWFAIIALLIVLRFS